MSFKIKSTATFTEECDEAYAIAETEMKGFYGASDIEELSQDQLDEIFLYSESDECEKWIGIALRSLVQSAEEMLP